MPLPFSDLDIITIDGQKFEVSVHKNTPNFCNLYEPGKPHLYDFHKGQLMLKPSLGIILFTKSHREGQHFLNRAPHYDFEIDYFFNQIDYPQKSSGQTTHPHPAT